jgi:hypothetical protein
MIRRDKDARRVAKSVRTHEETMQAFGKASSSAKAGNEAYAADPWSVKNKDLQSPSGLYRDKETSVKSPAPKKGN